MRNKNRNNKQRKSIDWSLVWLCVIGLAIGFLIHLMDSDPSEDKPYVRDFSGNIEQARAERECVNVTLSQLNELLSVLHQKSSLFTTLEKAEYDETEKKTVLNVDQNSMGLVKLLGSDKVAKRWEKYYRADGTAMFFDTEIIGQDTVVQIPAYIFVQIVDSYEKAVRNY